MAYAAPPVAPSGLTVQTLGVNAFLLSWNDNSSDENFFGIQARLQGQDDSAWVSLDEVVSAEGGQISHVQSIGSELTSTVLQFRILAIKSGPPQEISATSVVNAPATPASVVFNKPTSLTGTAEDGIVTLNWTDNANSEWGHEIENQEGTNTTWNVLGSIKVKQTSNQVINDHRPDTEYRYRIRAWKGNPRVYTDYSNVLTVSTLPLAAPTGLSAARNGERDVVLGQTDSLSGESGYIIDYRLSGASEWVALGSIGPNFSSINIPNMLDPATAYEFRVRSFWGDNWENPEMVSSPSNVAAAQTVFNAPSNLVAQVTGTSSISLSWTDASAVEDAYAIFGKGPGSEEFELFGYLDPNETSATLNGLSPGSHYEFYVAAAYQARAPGSRDGVIYSEPSNISGVSTRDDMLGPIYLEWTMGMEDSYEIQISTNSALVASSMTGLPEGLAYSNATHSIGGTPAVSGLFNLELSLEFADGWTRTVPLALRVLRAPESAGGLSDQALTPGGTIHLDLASVFTDPDAESAVRVVTNRGNMDFILFDSLAPLSVSNFMAYAEAGDYEDTVFHRNVPGFVLQGGGFRPDPANGPTAYVKVPTRPQLPNEFNASNSNVRATLSFAKLGADAPGGGPDSATNQFFINLANNGPNLDFQNGGFTVFGRVTLSTMSVADGIATLPTRDYRISLDGEEGDFQGWPLISSSETMDSSLAIRIQEVASIPVLNYVVAGNSSSNVVSASIGNGHLELEALQGGESTIVLRATDLDGHSTELSFKVTVAFDLASWLEFHSVPVANQGAHDDADGGGLDNLAEFAYMGDPNDPADDFLRKPIVSKNPTNQVLSVEFSVRKDAALRYVVRATSDISSDPTTWSMIWDSSVEDAMAAPQVEILENTPGYWRLRVRDTESSPADVRRYLSVGVSE